MHTTPYLTALDTIKFPYVFQTIIINLIMRPYRFYVSNSHFTFERIKALPPQPTYLRGSIDVAIAKNRVREGKNISVVLTVELWKRINFPTISH